MTFGIVERLERGASAGRGLTVVTPTSSRRVAWEALHERSLRIASELQAAGVNPGDIVGVSCREPLRQATFIEAVWLSGACLLVVPFGMTASRLKTLGVRYLLDDEVDSDEWPAPLRLSTARLEAASSRRTDRYEPPPVDERPLAQLQLTSGSTGAARAVRVPARQLAFNHAAIRSRVGLQGDDVLCSWLPLYHDMGLVGFFGLAACEGYELVLAAPDAFVRRPGVWMQLVERHAVTVTGAPNFAFELAARCLRPHSLDLSSLRVLYNGGELIRPAAVRAFVDAGRTNGLDPSAVRCCYGLAEATLAVAVPDRGTGMATDVVQRNAVELEGVASPLATTSNQSSEFAMVGSAIPGLDVRVVTAGTEHELPNRSIGEIEVRGSSVTPGYLWEEPFRVTRPNGWLATGDRGYLVDDQLVVCGRYKDTVIVGGRSIAPEEIERAVGRLQGIRLGSVIAVGVDDGRRDAVVVVAEAAWRTPELEREVVATVRQAIGIRPTDVRLVRRHSVPKTTSGKLCRSECRSLYVDGRLELAPRRGQRGAGVPAMDARDGALDDDGARLQS